MALTSNIVLDSALSTIVLSASTGDGSVETITYDGTVNQITIDTRDSIIIDFTEFLSFCDQVNIFQTAILFRFSSVSILATQPFRQAIANELKTNGNWNFTFSGPTDPDICQYEGTKSSSKLLMNARGMAKTLEFPEWVYFVQALNYYKLSIKGF